MTGSLLDDAAPRDGGPRANNLKLHHESTQLRLTPPAHRNAPLGSSDVAARMIAPYAATQRARILAFIRAAGPSGATASEVETALDGISIHAVSPRIKELRAEGRIVERGRRKTPSGRTAAVWVDRGFAEGGAA